MKTPLILTALAITCLPVFGGTPSPAAPLPPAPAAETGWQFSFAPYLWAQSLNGSTGVLGLTADVDVDFIDALGDLELGYMGAFEARYGRWGITTDLCYAELGESFNTRDVLFSGGNVNVQQLLGNLAVSYRVFESGTTAVELYGGARLNWIDVDLDISGVEGGFFSRSGDEFWADAIIGARFQTSLGGPWFLRVTGDIGAGDSDFTWQAIGILGYKVSESFHVGIGYRGLGTDYQDGGFTYDITAHGPVLGAEWRW